MKRCPVELIVEAALQEAELAYTREVDNEAKLDFYLTESRVYIWR